MAQLSVKLPPTQAVVRRIEQACHPHGVPLPAFLGYLKQVEFDLQYDASALRFVRDGSETFHEHRGIMQCGDFALHDTLDFDWDRRSDLLVLIDVSVVRMPPKLAQHSHA